MKKKFFNFLVNDLGGSSVLRYHHHENTFELISKLLSTDLNFKVEITCCEDFFSIGFKVANNRVEFFIAANVENIAKIKEIVLDNLKNGDSLYKEMVENYPML